MINVSELVTDPDFAQVITIHRSIAQWQDGRFVSGAYREVTENNVTKIVFVAGAYDEITTFGVAHEESDDVDQVPEGDRRKAKYAFYVLNPPSLYITQDGTTNVNDETMISDLVIHEGRTYKIMDVHDDTAYGYVKGVGELTEVYQCLI